MPQKRPPVETFYEYVIGSDRWARLRERLLRTRGRRCEQCAAPQTACDLQLHHLTYDRLGFERDDDLVVLCPPCHQHADRTREAQAKRRAAHARYWARLDGWASKRWGDDWWEARDHDEAADAFDRWRESRGEEAW